MRPLVVALALLVATPALAQSKRRGGKPAPAPATPRTPAPPPPAPEPAPAGEPEEDAPLLQRSRLRASGSALPTAVVLGMGAHLDDGTMRGRERVSVSVTQENFDFSNESLLYGSAALLLSRSERVRVGLGARYFGKYDYKVEGREERASLGRLFEAVALAEYALPMQDRMHLLLGAEAGLAVLFPGGELEAEIERLQAAGANVWNLPRLGYLLGPSVGGRYRLGERLAVRVDAAALWSQTFLFFTSDDVAGVTFEKRRRANIIRYRLGLSIEVPL